MNKHLSINKIKLLVNQILLEFVSAFLLSICKHFLMYKVCEQSKTVLLTKTDKQHLHRNQPSD